jgi:hypothetical protein
MRAISTKNTRVKWLYNDQEKNKTLMQFVSWRFDVDRNMLEDEEKFLKELEKFNNSDSKNNVAILANITLVTNDISEGHRNILIVDLKNTVYDLFEPNLVDENLSDDPDAAKTRATFVKTFYYFRKLLLKQFDVTFQSVWFRNLGNWMAQSIRKKSSDPKLLDVVFNLGACTLLCYIFLMWRLEKSCCCNSGELPYLEGDFDVEITICQIFGMVKEITTPKFLTSEPANVVRALCLIKGYKWCIG